MNIMHLRLSNKKAQQVARLLGQDTPQRVMDCIAEESKAEHEIAKELGMPLSTVHYNIQRLVEAGLVVSDEYTYSQKGKEMRHYKLASEHVIITTRPLAALPQALTGLGLSLVVAAGVWWSYSRSVSDPLVRSGEPMLMMEVSDAAVTAAAPAVWPWVLLGAGVMLLGMLLALLVQRYRT